MSVSLPVRRIALVMRDYDASRGGAERYFVNLSRALAALGHEVHVFAARSAGASVPGVRLHRVPMVSKPAFVRLISFSANTRAMLERWRGRDGLVVSLTMVYPCDVFRLGGEVQREWLRIRCPSAVQRMVKFLVNPVHLVNHYLEKRILDPVRTRQVVTISALEREIVLRHYPYPRERITVVYNGVDRAQFHPGVRLERGTARRELGLDPDEVVGVFPANNFHRKGLDRVVAALALLPPAERPLVLAAGRGRAGPYRSQAARCGVASRLRFAGVVERPERLYAASDFLVLPSRYDSFGNVHLEALGCGLPVVTSTMAGGSEIVRPGETGFVVSGEGGAAELAEAMAQLMDPTVRAGMSAVAAESVRDFTMERNARGILAVLERAAAERGLSGPPVGAEG